MTGRYLRLRARVRHALNLVSPWRRAYRTKTVTKYDGLTMLQLANGERKQVEYTIRCADDQIVDKSVSLTGTEGDD